MQTASRIVGDGMGRHTNAIENHWYLVSSHGAVLFYIAVNPDCTIREIADSMSLTQRTVWGLIGDLRRADMLVIRREGRRHHYTVNLEARFKHPTLDGVSLRTIMSDLVERFARTPEGRTAAGA
jgi:DNA-binding MarR family transcriptional regulator